MIPVIYPINKRYNSTSLLSSGAAVLKPIAFRLLPALASLAFSGGASAIGLGELHGQAILGEALHLKIEIVGAEKPFPDASCFRVVSPRSAGDIPWLRQARTSIRQGKTPLLEIDSTQPLRDPLLIVAVQLGCGNEVHREYTLLASPRVEKAPEIDHASTAPVVKPLAAVRPAEASAPTPKKSSRAASSTVAQRPVVPAANKSMAPVMPPALPSVKADRLQLSSVDVGDPSLSLSSALTLVPSEDANSEARRELLRLEFRMLQALYEQATSQLAAAEKLRNMESGLSQLQSTTVGLAERAQTPVTPGNESAAPGSIPVVTPQGPVANQPPIDPENAGDESVFESEWALYGVLGGALIALLVLLLIRRRRQQQEESLVFTGDEADLALPVTKSTKQEVRQDFDDVVLQPVPLAKAVEPLDIEIAHSGQSLGGAHAAPLKPADSMLSQAATTVDEQFEANPIIELADIMLSFGRVKGAAQALQDYIDNNPQEALQPWIRLMDVYRMAGMKDEFENVTKNLNRNFNVEIQKWEEKPYQSSALDLVLDESVEGGREYKPQGLEEMTHIIQAIIDMWRSPDVVSYMYQLLHDNRGGQRSGFSLAVVEEILFLIEIKEVSSRMEKEGAK